MPGAASKWICPVGYAYLNPTLPDDLTLIGRYCRRVPVSDLDPSPFEVVIDDPVDPIAVNPGDGSGLPPGALSHRRSIPGPFFYDAIGKLLGPNPLPDLLGSDCGCGCKGAGTCSPLGKTKKKAGLAFLALLLL